MSVSIGRTGPSGPDGLPGEEVALRDAVLTQACAEFLQGEPWRLVRNDGRRTFGVGTGLWPDLIALDASEVGVAWVLDVGTPSLIGDEAAWDRWRRLADVGHPFILAVPTGCGEMSERLAAMLRIRVGLVYEYGFTHDGIGLHALLHERIAVRA